jgi:hypothetical protein
MRGARGPWSISSKVVWLRINGGGEKEGGEKEGGEGKHGGARNYLEILSEGYIEAS